MAKLHQLLSPRLNLNPVIFTRSGKEDEKEKQNEETMQEKQRNKEFKATCSLKVYHLF